MARYVAMLHVMQHGELMRRDWAGKQYHIRYTVDRHAVAAAIAQPSTVLHIQSLAFYSCSA